MDVRKAILPDAIPFISAGEMGQYRDLLCAFGLAGGKGKNIPRGPSRSLPHTNCFSSIFPLLMVT
jgi:hypothetical protein